MSSVTTFPAGGGCGGQGQVSCWVSRGCPRWRKEAREMNAVQEGSVSCKVLLPATAGAEGVPHWQVRRRCRRCRRWRRWRMLMETKTSRRQSVIIRSCARIRSAPPHLYRSDPKARAQFCFCALEQGALKGLWWLHLWFILHFGLKFKKQICLNEQ